MKIYKLIGIGLLSISMLGLFGCSPKQSTQTDQKQQTSSVDTSSNDSNIQNNESGQSDNTQQNNDNQSSKDPNKADQSAQNDSSSQNSGQNQSVKPNPSANLQSNTPPQTKQEALAKLTAVLNTRVPLMLPTNAPVEKGKFLTGTTTSETWYYKVHLYETAKPANINSQAAVKGISIVTVEGTEYKNANIAKEAINGYEESQSPNANLGHGIKATIDAGMGHSYIVWNEGRWCLKMDSPLDSAYKNKKYPDSKKLAENIVTYLEDHALPAPQRIGVITINNWNQSPETTIQWQYHEMTYQVKSQDPMKALEVAVAMQFATK